MVTKSVSFSLLWLVLFKLVKFFLFQLEIFSNLDDSSLWHFDKVDTAKCISEEIFDHFDCLIELCQSECLFCFLDCLGQNGHKFIIVALMVLEMLHEVQIFSQQVSIIRQVLEIVFYKLFGILIILVVFHYNVAVLNQYVG